MNTADEQANGGNDRPAPPMTGSNSVAAGSPGPAASAAALDLATRPSRPDRDWPSIFMLILAIVVLAWNFLPRRAETDRASARVAVGQFSPPLRCTDPATGEPLLGLVPRGWFVWIVLAPDDDSDGARLLAELERAEAVWKTMADLDQWRRVIVTADAPAAKRLVDRRFEPPLTPLAVGHRRNPGRDIWSGAERVRHLMIEPTGRILLIEPAETDHPGSLEKIREDLRRRLRAWEGEFDDMPRFSWHSIVRNGIPALVDATSVRHSKCFEPAGPSEFMRPQWFRP